MEKILRSNPILKSVLVVLTFLLVSLIIYFPVLRSAPLWDDWFFIFKSHTLRNVSFTEFWLWGDHRRSWPMFYTIISMMYKLWQDNVVFYHLTNILLHSFNCFLIYRIIIKIKGNNPFLFSLFYLVHPLNFYSVAWMVQIKTLLAIFFFLISAYLFILQTEIPSRAKYWFSVLFFGLSLLSKSVFAPIVLLMIFYKDRKKILPYVLLCLYSVGLTTWSTHIKPLTVQTVKITTSFLSAAYADETPSVSSRPAPVEIEKYISPLEGLNRAFLNLTKYTAYIVYPWEILLVFPNTVVDYSFLKMIASVAFLAGLYLFVEYLYKKKNYYGLGGLSFYVISIFPLCGLFFVPIFHYSNFVPYWLSVPVLGLILCFSKMENNKFLTFAVMFLTLMNSYKIMDYSSRNNTPIAMITNSSERSPDNILIISILAKHYSFLSEYGKANSILLNLKRLKNVDQDKIDTDIEENTKAMKGEIEHEDFTL